MVCQKTESDQLLDTIPEETTEVGLTHRYIIHGCIGAHVRDLIVLGSAPLEMNKEYH